MGFGAAMQLESVRGLYKEERRGGFAAGAPARTLITPPDQLVGVQREPDRSHERECDERRDNQSDRHQSHERDRCYWRPRLSVDTATSAT